MSPILSSLRWRLKVAFRRLKNRPQPPAPAIAPTAGEERFDRRLVKELTRDRRLTVRHFRHIGKILSPKERRTVRLLSALAVACAAFLAFRAVQRHISIVPVAGGTYAEALVGAPQFINPLLSQPNDVDLDLASLVFSGLFRYDEHLNPVPDLAERYTVSSDGTVYVVTLKPNLRWHDGEPLTADDVVFTYASAQDPVFGSPLRFSLGGVQAEKTGDREITFRLAAAHERFLDLLTTGVLPEHLWGEIQPIHSTLNEYNLGNPIGSGPWRFKSLTRDSRGNVRSYTLVPFPQSGAPTPYLQEITFKFYPDYPAAIAALNERVVDGIAYLPQEYEKELTDPQVKRYALELPQYTAVFFNQPAVPALQDRRVRQALAAAIDREGILTDALKLRGELAESPILPDAPGFDPTLQATAYDPAAAGQLLDSAGWTQIDAATYAQLIRGTSTATSSAPVLTATTTEQLPDQNQYYRRNTAGAILELTLTTVERQENAAAAQLVAKNWRAIGVKVDVNLVPQSKITREIIKPRAYQAFLYGEAMGADPDPYPFWHSTQIADPGLNLAIYANRQVDKLLDDARAATDPDVRVEKYREFARLINAEIPAVFLYTPVHVYAVNAKVKGFTLNKINLPPDRFTQLDRWYVKTGFRWR
ncbi:MAG: ABC transporter substrate-binding protein [Patescibacteria group bacterium]|nr:ABC transporter substrate-binding protein [Patescibacteria group bacterium]